MANGDSSQPIDPNANTPAAPVAAAPTAAPVDASAPPTMPAQSVPSTVPAMSNADAVISQTKPYADQANQDAQRLQQLNQPDAPSAPTRHQRLMNMIAGLAQGLGTGLSAAGTSIGTHGAEGGAQEVAQIQGEQQRQQLAAKQAAMEAKNQQIQHLQANIDTNLKMMNMVTLQHTIGNDIAKSDLDISVEKQTLAEKVQNAQIQLAGAMKENYGFTPAEIIGVQSGQSGAVVDPTHVKNAQGMLSRTVGDPNDPKTTGAVAILGADNPAVKTALAAVQDPNASVQSVLAAFQGLGVALQQNTQVTAAKKASADATKATVDAAAAPALNAANIAKSRGQAASAQSSQAKNAFELTQEQHEAGDLSKPDVTGFSSPLTEKEYDKRYDAFTKSKDYQTLSTLKGSYQQFNDTLNHIAQTGDMNGAESVVGLFNAIGISATPLAGKGFRINANTVAEHAEARGIDQAAYQKLLSLKNGDVITPKQLQDYSNIAAGVYHNSYVNAADEAHRQGLPVDFLPQGGGQKVDPITARIYMDVVLHTNPALAKDPKAAQAAAKQAAAANGWNVQ